jgi:hypothetical protein
MRPELGTWNAPNIDKRAVDLMIGCRRAFDSLRPTDDERVWVVCELSEACVVELDTTES